MTIKIIITLLIFLHTIIKYADDGEWEERIRNDWKESMMKGSIIIILIWCI